MAEGIQTGAVALPNGTHVDRYIVDQVRERPDPFTLVYAARDEESDEAVQLTELFPAEFVAREGSEVRPRSEDARRAFHWGLRGFADQAVGLQRVNHPNIVRILRVVEINGTAYHASQPVSGEPLAAVLSRGKGGITADVLVPLVKLLVDALEQVHAAGLTHFDLRPETILIDGAGQPRLVDFGAARHIMRFKCRSLASAVAAGYAAPEVYSPSGQFGPWTDLYSLAAVVYHAIARGVPADAQQRQRGELSLKPAAKAGLGRYPEAFLDAVDWALRMDPAQRPQKVSDWREALAGRTRPPEATGAETAEVTRPQERRPAAVVAAEPVAAAVAAPAAAGRSGKMLAVIAVLAIVAIGIGIAVMQSGKGPAHVEEPAVPSVSPSTTALSSLPAPSNASQQQSVALDRLANELMARQATADAAVATAKEQATKAASAASASTDKAEKERLQKAAAEAQAREQAAREESARVQAELDQRLKEAEAEQRKKDEAALAAQQQAQQQAQKDAEAKAQAQKDADAKAQAQKDADAKAQAQKDADAKAQAQKEGETKAQTQKEAEAKVQAQKEAEAKAQAQKEAQLKAQQQAQAALVNQAVAGDQAAVIALSRKNCHLAAADVTTMTDLTYDKARTMSNARLNSDTGSVTLSAVRLPDGRYAAVEINKDSCAQIRGIRASP